MQEDQKDNKNNIRAEEENIAAAQAKQHEDEEEDTGISPKKTRQNKSRQEFRVMCCKTIRKAARRTTYVLKRNRQLLHG